MCKSLPVRCQARCGMEYLLHLFVLVAQPRVPYLLVHSQQVNKSTHRRKRFRYSRGAYHHICLSPQLSLPPPSISPFCSSLRVTSTSHYPPQSPSHRCDQNKNLPFSFSKLSKCSCERLSPDTHTSTTHKPTSPGYTMAAVLFTRHDLWSAPGKSFVLIVPVFRQLHTALRV